MIQILLGADEVQLLFFTGLGVFQSIGLFFQRFALFFKFVTFSAELAFHCCFGGLGRDALRRHGLHVNNTDLGCGYGAAVCSIDLPGKQQANRNSRQLSLAHESSPSPMLICYVVLAELG